MKTTFHLLALVLGLLVSACSSVNVEQRKGTDFSKYRTFAWAETQVKTEGNNNNPLLNSPLAESTIKEAIESELVKRGIRPVETSPDFYLTTHLYIEEAERTVANPPGPSRFVNYPYLVRYRGALLPVNYGFWYTPMNTGYRTETYKEGTLILDFIDAKTNNLVWRGSIADAVNNPARLGPEFAKAAREILDKFPVQERN